MSDGSYHDSCAVSWCTEHSLLRKSAIDTQTHALGQQMSCALFVFLLWCTAVSCSSSAVIVRVLTAQQLSDEISLWGAGDGNDTTILIMADKLSMHGVEFWQANNTLPDRFSRGTLTIKGSPHSGDCTIIDAAMRAGLTPPFHGTANLALENIIMINNCEVTAPVNNLGTMFTSSFAVRLWTRNKAYASVTYRNFTTYGRQADLATMLYVGGMTNIPYPAVRSRTRFLVTEQTSTGDKNHYITSYSYSTMYADLATALWRNVTLKSLDDPNDALLTSLKAEGTIMPQGYCNGTALPAEMLDTPVDIHTAPLYLSSTPEDFVRLLPYAANLSASQDAAGLPPAAMFSNGYINLTTQLLPQPVEIYGCLMIVGVAGHFDHPNDTSFPLTLDLRYRDDVITTNGSGSQLFLGAMLIRGLKPNVPHVPGLREPVLSSVLPLSAIKDTEGFNSWNNNPPLWLFVSAIELPLAEYLGLLKLAVINTTDLSPCLHPEAVAYSQQLAAAIYNLELFKLGVNLSSIQMASFTGWGMTGTRISFVPAGPIPAATMTCCNTMISAEGNSRKHVLSHVGRIAVIVGCSVGGSGLILLLAVTTLWWWRRQCRSDCSSIPISTASASVDSGKCLTTPTDTLSNMYSSNNSMPGSSLVSDMTATVSNAKCGVVVSVASLQQLVQQAEQIYCERAGFSSMSLDKLLPPGFSSMSLDKLLPPSDPDISIAPVPAMQLNISRSPTLAIDENCETEFQTSAAGVRTDHVVMMSSTPLHAPNGTLAGAASLIKRRRLHGRDTDKVVIKNVLGNGSWGLVYAGEWCGVPVAVKTMVFNWSGTDPTQHNTPAARREARAIMEAAIAASVGHPNLVATYRYDIKPVGVATTTLKRDKDSLEIEKLFSDDDSPGNNTTPFRGKEYKLYLVQELCGCSLHDALEARVLMQAQDSTAPQMGNVLRVLIDIAQGLAYLHGKGIVHGDLKPENILLKTCTTNRDLVIAKLADFGLSAHLAPDQTHISGFNAGTPFYVAPEVIQQFRTSTASDMYSFGVIMWQLWTGCTPYCQQLNGSLGLRPDFGNFLHIQPPTLYQGLCTRCLSVEPGVRPNAQEVVKQLSNLLQGGID